MNSQHALASLFCRKPTEMIQSLNFNMITFIKLLFKTIVDNKDISLVIETKLLKKKTKLQWSINGKIKNMLINLKKGHGS